jgi:hypothetical protein
MSWEAVREARQRLGKERGTIYKDWGGKIHIALIYPNSYYLGMSNLGFQTIYSILNSYENIVCERVFWEPQNTKTEQAISLESQRPLPDFDVLASCGGGTSRSSRGIIDAFVEEEMSGGIVFSPVVKDEEAFRQEMESHTPFYENVMNQGVSV